MPIIIFTIVVLVISASFHEFMHGWVAFKLGDNTAKDAGRLTMNPIAHLDPFTSVLLPLMLVLSNSPFFIAAAKPVPYNPYNLKDQKYGDMKVALGGPGSNLLLAISFGVIARLITIPATVKMSLITGYLTGYFSGNYDLLLNMMQSSLASSIYVMSIIIVFINLLLMIFNLIPVPPLDGSKILVTFLPTDWKIKFYRIEPYGFFIIIFLLLAGLFSFIWPILIYLFSLIVGF